MINSMKDWLKAGLLCAVLLLPQGVYGDWLSQVNSHRNLAGLPEVTENPVWSDGCTKHARYMVKNNFIGHTEDSSNPWYTPEGLAAAQSSNLFASSGKLTDDAAVDGWMEKPFHAVGILDPHLLKSGFGSYYESKTGVQTGACLDVLRGQGNLPNGVTFPIAYPKSGASMLASSYGGGESPDPLTSCPSYTAPTGPPIILQVGQGNVTPHVTAHSFSQGGTLLAHCVFDETSYLNPNSTEQALARAVLDTRDAIILLPRDPLSPGVAYTASITVNGQVYTWSFFGPGGGQDVHNDLNGDGRSDVLFRHSSGTVAAWLLNGTTLQQTVLLGATDPAWTIVGSGDVDGDGAPDLVFRHSSGTVAIWLMDGVKVKAVGVVGATDPNWQVAGVGDTNGDGKADIVFRHTSGVVAIWLMNGLTRMNVGTAGATDSNWQIVEVADLNGDGKSDLVFQHSSGAVAVWLLNGTVASQVMTIGAASPDWPIVGSGDADGDGKVDLIFRHSSGTVAAWLLDGLTRTGVGVVGMTDPNWTIAK